MRGMSLGMWLGLAACSPAAPPADAPVPPPAIATVDDAAAPTDAAAALPANTATLRGRIAYPSEELPAMRVCALDAGDPGRAYCVATALNQPHYALAVPPGAWWLLAWPQDTGTAGDPGLLSAASDCLGSGGVACDDHAPLAVVVAAGDTREALDINDWYYDPRTDPPPMEPRGE